MSDVTRILEQIDHGDPSAANQLLPLVYDELRKLAAARLAQEKPGQTLQATALVHEAYLRLVNPGDSRLPTPDSATPDSQRPTPSYSSRAHFFAAAAEAMRRILIEAARRKRAEKHGGHLQRVDLQEGELAASFPLDDLLQIDEALTQLAQSEPQAAKLVSLHCFAGLSIEQAAEALEIPERTAYRYWSYARAWLFRQITSVKM